MTVPLSGKKAAGRVVKVSDHRYDLVMAYRWFVDESTRPGGRVRGPYARANVRRADGRWTSIRMHDLIMGCKGVDHRNGDGLDNQDPNLRKATDAENNRNRGPKLGTTSAYKGVHWNRRTGKWTAMIQVDGKQRYLGQFADETDAARARDGAAIELHGEYARLNFPELLRRVALTRRQESRG